MKTLLSSIFLLTATVVLAQTGTQVVRGTVVDNITESPIPGAKVIILDTDPAIRAITDAEGTFRLSGVALGRQNILVTYFGYKDVLLKGIIVDAGKETVLTVRMIETVQEYEEVKVQAKRDKPINEMSLVSTRTFSVEETQKYAAAMNDPARMATSFAGVVSTEGVNNDISIRGNAPRGILWRMEGVEIPNPNHFSSVGTSGGGISILSAQLLGTSDFSTGAFAAEYGNALSGVFDLTLRKGNNERREFTFQAGVLGIDAAMEGPFKKGYGGSYLINYRYSTLGILQHIVPIGDESTNFQDLSFNIFLPTKKFGNFGLFGFGGLSDSRYKAERDTALWATEPSRQYEGVFRANTGAVGAWNKIRFGTNAFLKTNVSVAATENDDITDSLDIAFVKHREFEEEFLQKRFTLSSAYIHKLSAKTNFRTGFIYNYISFDFVSREAKTNVLQEFVNEHGGAHTLQGYFQASHQLSKSLTVNGGVHYLQLFLNNTYSVEPRASLEYKIAPTQSLSFGYGMHSQIQPLGAYYVKTLNSDGELIQPNKNLEMNKAQHFVLAYNTAIGQSNRIRAEVYYQHLYKVPVGASADSTYSLLNQQYGFETFELQSTGLGRNYGVELTFERSLKKGLYYLVSGSVFESKYQALNGRWYDTRYNTKYTLAITGGKDWVLKNPEKRRTFGVNVKSVLTGGMRYTPLDLTTFDGDYPVEDHQRNYSNAMPAYYRLDLRLSLKRDYKRVTGTIAIDLQNVLNRQNVGGQYYDTVTGDLKYWYHPGLLPILSYRLTF